MIRYRFEVELIVQGETMLSEVRRALKNHYGEDLDMLKIKRKQGGAEE